ncbi:MAG: nucleotidyltransferase domain-containing protein [Candidatus Micrarchaeia archaeon]|jgi:predicted nucleotidyltransferase
MEDVNKLTRGLKKIKSVRAAILFGSRARGKFRNDSDIDVCVITDREDDTALELSSEKYDISLFYKIPLQVRYRVFRDGKVLFNRDDKLFSKLKFWTIKMYLDEKCWRDRFTQKVLA